MVRWPTHSSLAMIASSQGVGDNHTINSGESDKATSRTTEPQIDAIMPAARALIGIAAQSVAEVEDQVTLPQLRVLVLIESRGTLNLNRLAEAMGIHPSNATRACDRLVAAGLLLGGIDNRPTQPDYRTDRPWRGFRGSVIAHRRAAVADALSHVPERRRRGLETAMSDFADGPGESFTDDAWKLGWPNSGALTGPLPRTPDCAIVSAGAVLILNTSWAVAAGSTGSACRRR